MQLHILPRHGAAAKAPVPLLTFNRASNLSFSSGREVKTKSTIRSEEERRGRRSSCGARNLTRLGAAAKAPVPLLTFNRASNLNLSLGREVKIKSTTRSKKERRGRRSSCGARNLHPVPDCAGKGLLGSGQYRSHKRLACRYDAAAAVAQNGKWYLLFGPGKRLRI